MTSNVLVFSRDHMLLETRRLVLATFFHARGTASIHDAEPCLPCITSI
jgi:hypothetical protein